MEETMASLCAGSYENLNGSWSPARGFVHPAVFFKVLRVHGIILRPFKKLGYVFKSRRKRQVSKGIVLFYDSSLSRLHSSKKSLTLGQASVYMQKGNVTPP